MERIQKTYYLPYLSYEDALDMLSDLCNKLFAPILKDEKHKLHNVLPPKVTFKYNFKNNKLFNIPKYHTNRFRDTFMY